MSNEILEQVKVAEESIDRFKDEVKERKLEIDKLHREEIQAYRDELQNALKKLELELDTVDQAKVESAQEELSQETTSYRQQMFDRYQEIKSQLVSQGVKEVVAEYGNFSHEESSDHR